MTGGPRPCPVCGAEQATPLDGQRVSTTDGSLELFARLTIVQCGNCGTKFSDRSPSADELAGFYARYRGDDQSSGEERPGDADEIVGSSRAISHVSLLSQYAGRLEKVLEIGPGFGHTLMLARAYLGAEVYAFEPDRDAAEFLEGNGIPNERAMFDATTSTRFGSDFDAVIASMVVEHAAEPVAFLAEMSAALRPGGYLLVEVPNYADSLFDYRYADNAHLFFPAPDTLRLAAERAGYEALVCKAAGPRWAGDPGGARQEEALAAIPGGSTGRRVRRKLRTRLGAPPFWVEDLLFREDGNTVKAVFRRPAGG
jgi:SAM-dependent methyltransferase